MAELVSRNPDALYNLNDSTFGKTNPMKAVIDMFPNGRWLNIYEIPFFNNTFLKADQYKNWNTGGLDQQIGAVYAAFAKQRIKY